MKRIIAISAGHDDTKKPDSIIRHRIRYLNYGLLGLATILKHQGGLDITVYQADSYSVKALFDIIEKSGIDIKSDCECFLLSIPSYYSMSWCIEFCKEVKEKYHKKVIVGGRWVVDNHVDWIRQQLECVDTVIEGFGERKLARLFDIPDWQSISDGATKCFEWLDYRLLNDYEKYQPCIEISRGCGAGCQFCADKNNKRLRNKPVEIVKDELDFLDQLYPHYSVYFEAPHFSFGKKWIEELCENLACRNRHLKWRCTSRVESVPTDLLGIMSDSGLKVLDIGLESASPKQLINMQKTKRPDRYLDLAEKLLENCAEHDIWVKFNLLLYAGETYDTIEETISWLLDHKSLIKDVSVSSLVYYYNMDSLQELRELGASIPSGANIAKTGYVDLNLSNSIDKDTAKEFTIKIPKMLANQRDFYDIKAVSYFEPDYTYDEFCKDIELCDSAVLPFSIENDK